MAFINWGAHYSVGIPVMDAQHKRMAELINKFQADVRDGAETKRLGLLMEALAALSLEHFESEEQLMEGIGYPSLEKHRVEHKVLLERLGEFSKRLEAEQKISSSESLLFFRAWILDHIQKHDRDYGVFLYNERAKRRADVVTGAKDKTKEPVA
jgi:hemerythrin